LRTPVARMATGDSIVVMPGLHVGQPDDAAQMSRSSTAGRWAEPATMS
jgi:hypothetical protein